MTHIVEYDCHLPELMVDGLYESYVAVEYSFPVSEILPVLPLEFVVVADLHYLVAFSEELVPVSLFCLFRLSELIEDLRIQNLLKVLVHADASQRPLSHRRQHLYVPDRLQPSRNKIRVVLRKTSKAELLDGLQHFLLCLSAE